VTADLRQQQEDKLREFHEESKKKTEEHERTRKEGILLRNFDWGGQRAPTLGDF